MSFFQAQPYSKRNITTVGQAIDSLSAFNALYAVSQCDTNSSFCGNADDTAMWRKLVWDAVINVGGEPMEYDFFETIFGGKTNDIEAKKLYFRYNDDIDMNIMAQESVNGTVAGDPYWIVLGRGYHSGGGKYSYPAKGYSLYSYEDKQWMRIVDKDITTPYGHRLQVQPHKKNYTVRVRKGKKMMISPTTQVSGLSSPNPTGQMQQIGYTNHVRPSRRRRDWDWPIDLGRGYEEVLQWGIMFDENGNEVDSWELFETTAARKDMKWAKNLEFFMGQSIDNPALLGDGTGQTVTTDYSGFDGYIPTMYYGGGQMIDYDPGLGFDLEADFNPTILRNDALKRTNEYVVLHALPFYMGLTRKANENFKSNAGNCTFDTFKRMGGDQSDIVKLGVTSWNWANMTLHFKQISALSDTRGIGNADFPDMAHFIPGNGLRDSKGKEIPAFQYFVPKGQTESGQLQEWFVDYRKTERIDKLGGTLVETNMMAIHAPHLHIMARPRRIAA